MKNIFSFNYKTFGKMPDVFINVIKTSPLFIGASEKEIYSMLACLGSFAGKYEKNEAIFHANENITNVGLVLSGSLYLEREDYWGNRSLLLRVEKGELFGEIYACEPLLSTNISAISAEETVVLFMDVQRITTLCTSNCIYHSQLIHNLLSVLAKKAYMLTCKINHITKRTTRNKLLSYFSEQALLAGSSEFMIPFNRQELADFLSVNRSAMSAELSRMQSEGIITFCKNHIKLQKVDNPL
ncbi:Crp/Fnr family transcriptional regulator [Pectinatus cerevisiiphilus]|uniref:CRP-like cAMP-binding protein n=1 Tax=Pectinatus cerevisiiphilus TaxID=86956 RepID=A0A4R3K3G1_9FIRM|nr:Crp/Fnr family transcriptional regulator [Pectinatus cerevisiiphilus]TCS77244.1 CRP-like cAMP-binding protein [Pectinatus cerevisiiphilus]